MPVLAFDVYGTLIDTSGVLTQLQKLVGEKAPALTELWRSKQLEYSFRRGLMQNYADFSVCTRQALDYCCRLLGVQIAEADRQQLLAGYRQLPAFADAREGLARLQGKARLFAFSNGREDDVCQLLEQAQIDQYFAGVVSCDDLRSFKPNPAVYAYFLRRAAATGHSAWMISGNPFDVTGALSAGMKAVWVKRSAKAVFDPWEFEPTATVASLNELAALIDESS